MTTVTVTVNDADVRRALSSAGKGVDRALRLGTNDAVSMLVQDQQAYPPPPAGSRYVRRNDLKRSWSGKTIKIANGWRGIIGSNSNIAPYNRRVQDVVLQAEIHQGRWRNTIQGTVHRRGPKINQMYANRLRQGVK